MEKYKIEQLVEGLVTGIEQYGIFISLDEGYTGLIHISELSNHFVKDVKEYAEIGEKIICKILEIDEENKQMKCSIKNTEYGEKKDQLIDHGFAPLKKQLPIWMDEKLKDMKKEK